LSPVISINFGLAHLERKEWSAAAEQFSKTLEVSPNYFVAHAELATALLRLGKVNEALLEAQRAAELSKRHSFALSVLGQVTAASGNTNDALSLIKEIEQKPIKGESDKFFIAAIYAGMGDRDEAFAWLEKSFKEHNTAMTNLRIDPFFESLSDDPRFKDIIRRMGLPE
jgi:tetratricopeptide (TPR) repeat protein